RARRMTASWRWRGMPMPSWHWRVRWAEWKRFTRLTLPSLKTPRGEVHWGGDNPMKRAIPILLLLAIGGAVVYIHPQWFRKPTATNILKLSGNIEAHESLV